MLQQKRRLQQRPLSLRPDQDSRCLPTTSQLLYLTPIVWTPQFSTLKELHRHP